MAPQVTTLTLKGCLDIRELCHEGGDLFFELIYSLMNEFRGYLGSVHRLMFTIHFSQTFRFSLNLKDTFSKQNCITCRLLTVLELEIGSHIFFFHINAPVKTHQTFKHLSCGIEKVGFVHPVRRGDRIIALGNWCISPLGHCPRKDPAS